MLIWGNKIKRMDFVLLAQFFGYSGRSTTHISYHRTFGQMREVSNDVIQGIGWPFLDLRRVPLMVNVKGGLVFLEKFLSLSGVGCVELFVEVSELRSSQLLSEVNWFLLFLGILLFLFYFNFFCLLVSVFFAFFGLILLFLLLALSLGSIFI